MIVLHAGVCDDQLLLWGETPAAAVLAPKRGGQKRNSGSQTTRLRPHPLPYNVEAESLLAALREGRLGFTADKKATRTVTAWLPTLDNQPVASSPLIAELPESHAQPTLTPWGVTTLPLSTEQAVETLCACVGKQMLVPGVIIGTDLQFWATALRFAGALVARQQFLPGVKERCDSLPDPSSEGKGKGVYRACWQPVFVGPDAALLTKLAKTMPPACRALTHEAVSPPTVPAVSTLSDYIAEMVDHLVRCSALPGAYQRRKQQRSFDSMHDQWLSALRSSDGTLRGQATELAQLAAQIQEWQRPIAIATATPFRLCFRLEEPQSSPESESPGVRSPKSKNEPTDSRLSNSGLQTPDSLQAWYVRYLLQATDDPSLLVEAQDAWNAKGSKAALLKRGGFDARHYLLSSLGQAAGICPHIEGSLKTAAPGGYMLDTTSAYAFLTEKAIALEEAGFGVLLPAWWTRKGTKLRLTARAEVKSPKMQNNSGLSLDTIVQFQWQVALGNEHLSFEELTALAKLKQPLVKVRGQWVQMSAEEIQAALEFWKKQAAGKLRARDVVQMALGAAGKAPGGIAFAGVTATGWVADLLAQLDGHTTFTELLPPDGFQGTLRPYQVRGYSWLAFLRRWGLGACLADDMGLGKTIETLAMIQRDWHTNGRQPVLLICPTSVVGNWRKEASRFTPALPVMVHHGMARTKGATFPEEAQKQALIISSYALLHRDFAILNQVPWGGVILDEAQNIKNPETKQARSARALAAAYRVALTGTPVENNVGDLWSILEFLNPGFLGTQTEFKKTFFLPIQANRDPEAIERLKRLTGPFILRRLKTDKTIIADLPEKQEMKVFCTLTKEQASLYAAVVQEALPALDDAEGIQRKGVILATLSKLKQVCNHPTQFLGDNSPLPGRSGKLARLTEMLEEVLAVGDRTLVFSQFAEMGALLRRHLQETFGREVLFLHGAVPKPHRDRMVERFQADGDSPPIFILSLKAGGTGLNLTRANHVFHFDRWWNPAVEDQATDRAFRIGQTKNVQVHKFLCLGTLEEKIDEMIERKKEVAAGVVGTGEGWLTELSTAALKDLFALRKEAIGE